MTRVITRYFESADAAHKTKKEFLYRRRFAERIVRLYETADGVSDRLTKAGVAPDTAKAYQTRLAKGGAVLLVRAGHKPLCVAQTTRDVTAEMGGPPLADLVEEVVVPDDEDDKLSVLRDRTLILTKRRDPDATGNYMADWPIPLLSKRKPKDQFAFPRHARMANWPIPLISRRKPYRGSIFPPHARMADWPIPLLSSRKPYDEFAFPRHARMADWPIPLISQRKPYTGSLIPRHARMANWPFPHLIDGKTGTNSLMPGAPRMANFPIPLLSGRKPYDKSIFSRHARMASFPIPLLSRRKPFTGSIFPRHARMADFLLPLVIRRTDKARGDGQKEWSFSAFFGMPTLIRR